MSLVKKKKRGVGVGHVSVRFMLCISIHPSNPLAGLRGLELITRGKDPQVTANPGRNASWYAFKVLLLGSYRLVHSRFYLLTSYFPFVFNGHILPSRRQSNTTKCDSVFKSPAQVIKGRHVTRLVSVAIEIVLFPFRRCSMGSI